MVFTSLSNLTLGKRPLCKRSKVRSDPQTFSYSLCPGEFLGHQPPCFEACGSSEISLLSETDPPQPISTILHIRGILRRHLIYSLGPSCTHAASVCCGVCATPSLGYTKFPEVLMCVLAPRIPCTHSKLGLSCTTESRHI